MTESLVISLKKNPTTLLYFVFWGVAAERELEVIKDSF